MPRLRSDKEILQGKEVMAGEDYKYNVRPAAMPEVDGR